MIDWCRQYERDSFEHKSMGFPIHVLLVCIIQKRYKQDLEVNSRPVSVVSPLGELIKSQWQDIVVGDIVRVRFDECLCRTNP